MFGPAQALRQIPVDGGVAVQGRSCPDDGIAAAARLAQLFGSIWDGAA
jgi:hypothetical protein